MRTKMSVIAAIAILSMLLVSPYTITVDGTDLNDDGTFAMTPSDAMEVAFYGTDIDTDELSMMLDNIIERMKSIADVKVPSLTQIVRLLADVSKKGTGCLIIDGEYIFDKDVNLHRLYIKEGADINVAPGVSVKTDKLYIDTSGGMASFSTGEGASISFGDAFIERIPIPLKDTTVTTESTTISTSCSLSNSILDMSLTASYDDTLSLSTKQGTVTYYSGNFDLSASLDFKKILDPQFRMAVTISGGYGSEDVDTPFYIEGLNLMMGSVRDVSGNRDIYLSLSLERVIAGPVDNKNMIIEMSFPLSHKNDSSYGFHLYAESIHVHQVSIEEFLVADIEGLSIMFLNDIPCLSLSYESLLYRNVINGDIQILKEGEIEGMYILFQGVYEKSTSDMKKSDRLISVNGTIEVKSNDYYMYSSDPLEPDKISTTTSELEGLNVQFKAGIPTDIRIILISYQYSDDSGKEISWSDIDYEIILFGDDSEPSPVN